LASTALGSTRLRASNDFDLNKTAFLAQLNTDFLFTRGGSKVAVKLVDVSDLPQRGTRTKGEAFSLMFRGDRSKILKQDTYVIKHNKLGEFSFLVVPIMRKDKSAPYYEAVINRLHS
jgi:hypothetical protein